MMIGACPNDLKREAIPLVVASLTAKTVTIEALPIIIPSVVRTERMRLRDTESIASDRYASILTIDIR